LEACGFYCTDDGAARLCAGVFVIDLWLLSRVLATSNCAAVKRRGQTQAEIKSGFRAKRPPEKTSLT
jgi:hypothetical protein